MKNLTEKQKTAIRTSAQAFLDQEWLDAENWLAATDNETALAFGDCLEDEHLELLTWMAEVPEAACIVKNLARLALKQAALNLANKGQL